MWNPHEQYKSWKTSKYQSFSGKLYFIGTMQINSMYSNGLRIVVLGSGLSKPTKKKSNDA